MPLGGDALSAGEIDLIARWIDGMASSEGAAGKQEGKPGWPWTKLREPQVPPVQQQDWVSNSIDAFILAQLEKKGLRPAPPASRPALLRRLYFGLIGLPPTPEDMARFQQDSSAEAYSRAVERLLSDSRYGERWGRHWLDLVRYADTRGGGLEYPRPHMWRYRDYVVRAFNQDRPYDRFIKEQLAADAFPAYGDEGKIGASFLTLGVRVERSAEEGRRDVLIDVVDTTGATFLGITLGCARCHDHKYDPISIRDYYRLEAFFAPLTFGAKPLKFTQYEAPLQQPKWWKQKSEAWDRVLSERKQAGRDLQGRAQEAGSTALHLDESSGPQGLGGPRSQADALRQGGLLQQRRKGTAGSDHTADRPLRQSQQPRLLQGDGLPHLRRSLEKHGGHLCPERGQPQAEGARRSSRAS